MAMRHTKLTLAAAVLTVHSCVLAINFPWEQTQLTDTDIGDFSAIAFGNQPAASGITQKRCRTFPGDAAWPSVQEWNRLNASLGGALIQTVPQGAYCYPTHPTYN